MNKNDLLKNIAEKSYDVGIGTKKHFATNDIVEKAPGIISFSSMAFGIITLVLNGLSTEIFSAIFIILGVVSLYINFYDHEKLNYEQSGVGLKKILNSLKELYFDVKNLGENDDLTEYRERLSDIDSQFYPLCISKQILFSNWYSHYKFFWEDQIGWIDEQLKFKLFRDKLPLSLTVTLFSVVIAVFIYFFWYFELNSFLCNYLVKE